MKNHEIKAYEIIADDGRDVYRVHVPATSDKAARDFIASASMEAVRVRRGERSGACPISADCIAQALRGAAFGQMEIDLIVRALTRYTDFVM